MSFAIVIPARMESTRLPGKVLADIGGKPMVQHVWERCLASGVGDVWITTDSMELTEAMPSWADVVTDTFPIYSGSHRVAVAARTIPELYDYYIDVQADIPFVPPAAIRAFASEVSVRHPQAMSVVTRIVEDGPNVVKVLRRLDGSVITFGRKVKSDWREVGIYAYSAATLARYLEHMEQHGPTKVEKAESIEQLGFLTMGVHWDTMEWAEPMISVDTPEDLERAREAYVVA